MASTSISDSADSEMGLKKLNPLGLSELPETFEERYNQLRHLIGQALLHLLDEAKKRDKLSQKHPDRPAHLVPPYGRLPRPSPKITRREFLAMKERGLSEFKMDIEDIEDPAFEFKFGFNPLMFIANYLKVI